MPPTAAHEQRMGVTRRAVLPRARSTSARSSCDTAIRQSTSRRDAEDGGRARHLSPHPATGRRRRRHSEFAGFVRVVASHDTRPSIHARRSDEPPSVLMASAFAGARPRNVPTHDGGPPRASPSALIRSQVVHATARRCCRGQLPASAPRGRHPRTAIAAPARRWNIGQSPSATNESLDWSRISTIANSARIVAATAVGTRTATTELLHEQTRGANDIGVAGRVYSATLRSSWLEGRQGQRTQPRRRPFDDAATDGRSHARLTLCRNRRAVVGRSRRWRTAGAVEPEGCALLQGTSGRHCVPVVALSDTPTALLRRIERERPRSSCRSST